MIRTKYRDSFFGKVREYGTFEESDFDFIANKANTTEYSSLVSITYLPEPTFQFSVKFPRKMHSSHGDYVFECTFSPGPLSMTESSTCIGADIMYRHFSSWLRAVEEELLRDPLARQVRNHSDQINEILKNIKGKNVEFTQDEINSLKERLDKLEKEFAEQIKKKNTDAKKAREQVELLHKDFELLKQTLPTLKKQGWMRVFLGKTLKWAADPANRKLLGDSYNVVRGLLPDAGLPELPK